MDSSSDESFSNYGDNYWAELYGIDGSSDGELELGDLLRSLIKDELGRLNVFITDEKSELDYSVSEASCDDDDDFYNCDDEQGTSTPVPNDLKWSLEPSEMKKFDFTGEPGLKIPVPRSSDPIVYFDLLVDSNFYNMILEPTNTRAKELYSKYWDEFQKVMEDSDVEEEISDENNENEDDEISVVIEEKTDGNEGNKVADENKENVKRDDNIKINVLDDARKTDTNKTIEGSEEIIKTEQKDQSKDKGLSENKKIEGSDEVKTGEETKNKGLGKSRKNEESNENKDKALDKNKKNQGSDEVKKCEQKHESKYEVLSSNKKKEGSEEIKKSEVKGETSKGLDADKEGEPSGSGIKGKRPALWRDLTKEELRMFLAVLYQSGNARNSKNFVEGFTGGRLSYERFHLIVKSLSFSPNQPSEKNRLYKLNPLIDFFNKKMESIYYPGKQLIIEDPMVLVDGQILSRHKVRRNDGHEYGVKLFTLSAPRGLVQKVYSFLSFKDIGGKKGASQPEHVVMKLMEGKLNKGHSLYTTQSYTSIPLARKLLTLNTHLTGMVRRRRKYNPTNLEKTMIKYGEVFSTYSDSGITMQKWLRQVQVVGYILSTQYCGMEHIGHNGFVPNSFLAYKEMFESQTRMQIHSAYYPAQHTAFAWFRKFGIHILQLLLTNSWLLHKMYSGNTLPFDDYRRSVLKSLVERPQQIDVDDVEHKIQVCEKNEFGETQKRVCEVCKSKGRTKLSFFLCPACPSRPGLCITPCFKIYHSDKSNQNLI